MNDAVEIAETIAFERLQLVGRHLELANNLHRHRRHLGTGGVRPNGAWWSGVRVAAREPDSYGSPNGTWWSGVKESRRVSRIATVARHVCFSFETSKKGAAARQLAR